MLSPVLHRHCHLFLVTGRSEDSRGLGSFPRHGEIQILNAERRIDLSSHIVKVFLTLKVENVMTAPASEIVLAFPPAQADHLALVKAQAAIGKKKKKSYVHLDVNPTELPDAPNGTKYFSISLLNPLSSGETATLEVLYILTHSLKPFPAEISQSESQLVYFRDSALILSPYHVKQQTTFLKTPSTKVESFTRVEPTKFAGRELKAFKRSRDISLGQHSDNRALQIGPCWSSTQRRVFQS
ncbi:hypothetical protein OIU85_006693 [Salix viminalis]|uniref:Dolichyl-diphosphooligosaccharide--protein glycosyltransferase subunit 1 n=1 Tax=Salix viminalis TaxID=40686 RepID=A0A9Q0SUZ1_SALVM|nr:hypothetical protein OIU85_006693 [Salix viminalis]